jgi:Tfp pilus assembly protein PilN
MCRLDCSGKRELSNIASTHIGIIIGALIRGFISWLIYSRQEKIFKTQDKMLISIKKIQEKHEHVLEKVQKFEEIHDKILNDIFILEKKIDSLLESK